MAKSVVAKRSVGGRVHGLPVDEQVGFGKTS